MYSYLVGIKTSILALADALGADADAQARLGHRCSHMRCVPKSRMLRIGAIVKGPDLFIAAIGDSKKYRDRLNTGDEILYACHLHASGYVGLYVNAVE